MTPSALGAPQQRLGLVDHRRIPQRRILLGKRHVLAVGVAPRRAPGLRVKHQREQAQRLRLLRQQLGHEPRQEQIASSVRSRRTHVGPARVGPAFGEARRRWRPARRRAARRAPRAPERETECRPAGSCPWRAPAACPSPPATMRNAEAIVFASSPSTTCSISGARMPASIAGCAQANISARRWSGISALRRRRLQALGEELQLCRRGLARRCRRPRRRSILRRATVSSHASGFAGQPFTRPVRERRRRTPPTARPRPPPRRACAPRERRRACRSCGARPRPRSRAPARRLLPSRHGTHRVTPAEPTSHTLRSRHRPDRAHLDDAVTRARAARRPADRGVEIGHVDEVVAAELLLRVRIRAVQHLRLAVGEPHGGRRGARLQPVRADQRAGLRQTPRCRRCRPPCPAAARPRSSSASHSRLHEVTKDIA